MHDTIAAAAGPRPAAEVTLRRFRGRGPAFSSRNPPGLCRADDLMLAVSELASNAVLHSPSGNGGTVTVRIRTALRWARAEVTDDGPAGTLQAAGNGWGLEIVRAVTDRCGAASLPDGRRTAWAEVTWP